MRDREVNRMRANIGSRYKGSEMVESLSGRNTTHKRKIFLDVFLNPCLFQSTICCIIQPFRRLRIIVTCSKISSLHPPCCFAVFFSVSKCCLHSSITFCFTYTLKVLFRYLGSLVLLTKDLYFFSFFFHFGCLSFSWCYILAINQIVRSRFPLIYLLIISLLYFSVIFAVLISFPIMLSECLFLLSAWFS